MYKKRPISGLHWVDSGGDDEGFIDGVHNRIGCPNSDYEMLYQKIFHYFSWRMIQQRQKIIIKYYRLRNIRLTWAKHSNIC